MEQLTDIVVACRATREFPCEQDFENCINSVVRHTSNARFVFCDDASDSVGATVIGNVASRYPTSLLLRTQSQNWFSRMFNKGLRLVRTPKAVILNCDTIVDDGWLDELYAVWKEVEEQTAKPVGLVASLLNPQVAMRWRCTVPPHFCTAHCVLLDMSIAFRAAENRGTPGFILDEVNPACIHIRSDVELSHRLNGMGYQTVESFRSAVGHRGGASWGQLLGSIPSSLPADI